MASAIVNIKRTGTGSGKSGLTRYIAESKRDPQREELAAKEARPLFSDREDRLTYSAANQYLTRGNGAPINEDIIHLVISPEQREFERLGGTVDERKEKLRQITRETMNELEKELGIEKLYWVAGIHLNTENPHVHIAIDRDAVDRNTGLHVRIAHIPRRLLGHKERQPDGSKEFVPGRIEEAFLQGLEKHRAPVRSLYIQSRSKDLSISREIVSARTLQCRDPYPQERTIGAWLLAEIDLARPEYSGEERAKLEASGEALRAEVTRIDQRAIKSGDLPPAAFLETEGLENILRDPPASLVIRPQFVNKEQQSPARTPAAVELRDHTDERHSSYEPLAKPEHVPFNQDDQPPILDLVEEHDLEMDRSDWLQSEIEHDLPEPSSDVAQIGWNEYRYREDELEHETNFVMDTEAGERSEPMQTQPHNGTWKDRYILGRSMVAKAQYERLLGEYKSAVEHGDKRRFLVYDDTWGRTRRISEFDIRRRGNARAGRETYERCVSDPTIHHEERQQRFEDELERHDKGIRDHRIILDKTIKMLEEKLKTTGDVYDGLKPRAQAIQRRYQATSSELPLPIVTPEELRDIQDLAIAARKPDRVAALERIRQGLARERGEPTRTDRESARLAGQLLAARIELASHQARAEQFEKTRHLTPWEIEGGTLSLTDLERRIMEAKDRTQVFGKEIHPLPSGRRTAAAELERLEAMREQVQQKTADRRNQLHSEIALAAKMASLLSAIHRGDTIERADQGLQPAGREMTRHELNQIEQHALQTKDAALLTQFYLLEESYEEKLPVDNKPTLEKRASRARGRETVAEIPVREAEEQLREFEQRMPFVPVMIRKADGREQTARLWDYRDNRNPYTATLDRLLESRERREERRSIETAIRERHDNLKDECERARACFDLTSARSPELSARVRGEGHELPPADFTPKQINQIEIYAAGHHDRGERARLENLIDTAEKSGHVLSANGERRSLSGATRDVESTLERNKPGTETFPSPVASAANQAAEPERASTVHHKGKDHVHGDEHPLIH
jgi:hypothetical protein